MLTVEAIKEKLKSIAEDVGLRLRINTDKLEQCIFEVEVEEHIDITYRVYAKEYYDYEGYRQLESEYVIEEIFCFRLLYTDTKGWYDENIKELLKIDGFEEWFNQIEGKITRVWIEDVEK